MLKWLFIFLLQSSLCLAQPANAVVTNPDRYDGFGAQFQTIIYSIIYAERENKPFVYTPFRTMEHNYDGDPEFLQKKEWLVNLTGSFPLNKDRSLQTISADEYVWYFERNLVACAQSDALKKVKKIFRANKERSKYFDNRYFNIAVHIRRHNAQDGRVAGTNTPDGVYIAIINMLRKKYAQQKPLFHIYSQGDLAAFKKTYVGDDVVFHIDESIEDTFTSLVLADALVTSGSSFSYTAAILSDSPIYYLRFWHPPLPGWNEVRFGTNAEEFKKYNLVYGLPDVLISTRAEQIGCTWRNGSVYDKPLINAFYALLKEKKGYFVALDVGAQTGCFALLAKYFPNSRWYAFEPIQEAADVLRAQLLANKINNVDVYCLALSDARGTANLKLPSNDHWGLSTLGEAPKRFNAYNSRVVECIDLDSFVEEQKIEKIDFIKIDTEGWELFVLRGGKKMIARDKPTILMEFNSTNMAQCGVAPSDVIGFLNEVGYAYRLISGEDFLCTPIGH